MTVAVIGPNAAHRRIVAKALSGSEARTVREFIDYPAKLTDIQRLMEQQRFDVVMIDVDSDQSYALEVVQKFAALENVMVMVYSKRSSDQALLRSCIEAGARDFLPLPADDAAPEHPTAPPMPDAARRPQASPSDLSRAVSSALPDITRSAPPVQQESPRAAASEAAYRAPMPSYEPERRPEAAPSRPVGPIPVPSLPSSDPGMVRQPKPNAPQQAAQAPPVAKAEPKPPQAPAPPAEKQAAGAGPNDFAAWDNAWIRASQTPANGAAEVDTRSVAPPAVKKPAGGRLIGGAAATTAAQPQQKAAPRVPAAPAKEAAASAPLFRGVEESSEAQGPNLKKWALIGGVPVILIAGLSFAFMRGPAHHAAPASPQTQVVTPEPDPSTDATESQTATSAPAPAPSKPSPVAQSSSAKPSPTAPANQQAQANKQVQSAKPVSADLMTAQLSAPSKIGVMKKPGTQDEAPPTGFNPGAIGGGGSMPGGVFGSKNNVKVVAGVSAISAGVADGMVLHRTAPIFPQFARQAHMSGTIVLGATINASGSIEDLHILSGPEIFRGPAMDAVKTWRYRPYKLNNEPVPVQTTIRVIFSLDQH
jgi:protein TonB